MPLACFHPCLDDSGGPWWKFETSLCNGITCFFRAIFVLEMVKGLDRKDRDGRIRRASLSDRYAEYNHATQSDADGL